MLKNAKGFKDCGKEIMNTLDLLFDTYREADHMWAIERSRNN